MQEQRKNAQYSHIAVTEIHAAANKS